MSKWNPFYSFGEFPGSRRFISGGGQKSSTDIKQLPMWTGKQRKLFSSMYPILSEGLTEGVNEYPGNLYVERTPEEEAYLSKIPTLANEVASIRSGLGKSTYTDLPQDIESYYQQYIRDPYMYEFENVTLPGTKEAYVGPGYWGSARAGGVANAWERLGLTLGKEKANLYWTERQAERQAANEAAAREAMYGLGYANEEEEMLGTAGQYARMIKQEETMANLQRWLMGEEVGGQTAAQFNPFIQLAFQALGLQPYTYGTESKSSGWNFGVSY